MKESLLQAQASTSPPSSPTTFSASSSDYDYSPVSSETRHIVWSFDRKFCEYDKDWPNPPQIPAIRVVLEPFLDKLNLGRNPRIECLSGGSYHKVFRVRRRLEEQRVPVQGRESRESGPDPDFVFRAALPVYPFYKTASEVATMAYVCRNTDIPVPQVYAYDTSSNNALGHEWILMAMVEGASTYSQVEESLNIDQKRQIARQLADWVHQLAQLRFDSIGSLYFQTDLVQVGPSEGHAAPLTPVQCSGKGPALVNWTDGLIFLGPVVSGSFFGDWRNEYEFDRGPYRSVSAFLDGLLDVHRLEATDPRQRARSELQRAVDDVYEEVHADKRARKQRISSVEMEWIIKTEARLGGPLDPCVDWTRGTPFLLQGDDLDEFEHAAEDAAHVKRAAQRPEFATIRQDLTTCHSSCQLHHWDVAGRNFLIDDTTGDPVAVLDWEQVVSMPSCLIDFYPKALLGFDHDGENDDLSEPSRPDSPRDTEEEEVFQERMDNYEAKLLRDEFRDYLGSLDPASLEVYEARREHDFQPRRGESPNSTGSPEALSSSATDTVSRRSSNSSLDAAHSPSDTSSHGSHLGGARLHHTDVPVTPPSDQFKEISHLHEEVIKEQNNQRARAAEAAIRRTFDYIRFPTHHAWRMVCELYSALGYDDAENCASSGD